MLYSCGFLMSDASRRPNTEISAPHVWKYVDAYHCIALAQEEMSN